MRIMLPVLGVFIVVFGLAMLYFFKIGLDESMAQQSLKSVPIEAPAGWQATPYEAAHGERITGQPVTDAGRGADSTNDILKMFDTVANGDVDGVATTYVKGDELIALRIRIAPYVKPRLSMAERMGMQDPNKKNAPPPDPIFATLDGVPVRVSPREATVAGQEGTVPVNYRYLHGIIGDTSVHEAVEVVILTNSSDAAIAAVLGALDIPAFNEKAPTTTDMIHPGEGLVPQVDLPLSETPPPPTARYGAHRLLETKTFDELNTGLLEQIRSGALTSMTALQDVQPELDVVSMDVLLLLDDGTPANLARYYATLLIDSGRDWSNIEFYVLNKIADITTSQASLAEYVNGDYEIAPEILALVRQLPENAPQSDTVPAATAQQPAARLGGGSALQSEDCKIENGVRRCVIGGN